MRVTGMPVHLATMRAISSSSISSLRRAWLLDGFHFLLGGLDVFLDLREAAVAELGGLFPIAGAAGLLLFLAQGLLLLFEGADAIDGALFAIPALLEDGGFAADCLQFVFHVAQALAGGAVASPC